MVVTAVWETLASYQGYLDSAGRDEDMEHMWPLLADVPGAVGPARLYEISICAQPSSSAHFIRRRASPANQ